MFQDEGGWGKVFDFMLSGSVGSLVIWALLVYALWSAIFEGPWAKDDGVNGGILGDSNGDGDGD